MPLQLIVTDNSSHDMHKKQKNDGFINGCLDPRRCHSGWMRLWEINGRIDWCQIYEGMNKTKENEVIGIWVHILSHQIFKTRRYMGKNHKFSAAFQDCKKRLNWI